MSNPRLMRTELLLGSKGMSALQNSSVMIIGLGAVGGYALEAIARSGVGTLILVDFDLFDDTNVNRQILALSSTIGQKKTSVAASRVKEINPDCKVIIKDMYVDENNLPELMSLKPDFVVDAIDSLASKASLIAYLTTHHIDFISSMGAALKTDPSCIKAAHLNQTKNCSLARALRQKLKQQGVDLKEVHCVYSDENVDLPPSAIIMPQERGQNKILGSLPTITAIFGLTIANYVIKHLSHYQG